MNENSITSSCGGMTHADDSKGERKGIGRQLNQLRPIDQPVRNAKPHDAHGWGVGSVCLSGDRQGL